MIKKIMRSEQEQIIRRARLFGNGAHIFVPKEWAGNEIILIRKGESLRDRILKLLDPYLDNIIGAYLYGSRARNDSRDDSDIDLLIISGKHLKIKESGFEILSIRESEIDRILRKEPILMNSILAEAKPIINSKKLAELRERYKLTDKDVKNYVIQTKKIIEKNKELLNLDEKLSDYASQEVIYSMVLRLRGVYIIYSLKKNRPRSNREFRRWMLDIGFNVNVYKKMYEIYRSVKYDKRSFYKIEVREAWNALNLLKKEVLRL